MKYWLLIAGYTYYPDGGTSDWIETFHSLEEAKKVVQKPSEPTTSSYQIYGSKYDWYDIVDLRKWLNRPDRPITQRSTHAV